MVKTQVSSLKPNNHNTTATTMQQLEENRTHKVPQLHTTPQLLPVDVCWCGVDVTLARAQLFLFQGQFLHERVVVAVDRGELCGGFGGDCCLQ